MRPILVASAATALSFAAASALDAQARYESPRGPVEVMGLRTWTLPMLRDSIRFYVPGQELHDAACMVTLREKLGFKDALVMEYTGYTGDGKSFLVIKVVEPQSAARVQWNAEPTRFGQSLLPRYADLILPVTDSTGGVYVGRIQQWLQHPFDVREQLLTVMQNNGPRANAKADADLVTNFQRARATEADRSLAMRALTTDSFWANRFTAAVVLANFPQYDTTWTALVHALRDPNESVRGAALNVLRAMPARTVDWRPATADLRALLGGTNVSAIGQLFGLLTSTQVAPELAGPLLANNADWVLDHLASTAPMAPREARTLLRRLNRGVDLGAARADWETWTKTLK